MSQQTHQVIFLGDYESDKSELSWYLWEDYWSKTYTPRTGCSEVIEVTALHDCEQVKVQIRQPMSTNELARYQFDQVPDATVVLLVYDVTQRPSFIWMNAWYMVAREINKTAHVVVIGNKLRFTGQRAVNQVEAENYAKSIHAQYFEPPTDDPGRGRDELVDLIAELPLPSGQDPQALKDVRRVIDNTIDVVTSRWYRDMRDLS